MSVEISITEETIETTVNGDTIEVNIVTPGSAGVVSFNSRTGVVIPASGDYTSDQITETLTRVFVTPEQKTALGTALQPEDVGTAAAEDVEAFATAAQGELADTALQSLPTHGNEAHDATYVDAAGAAAAAPVQNDDSRLTDKRDPNDHTHAGTGTGGTVAHSATTSRDSADSHPETAISSAYTALVVADGAATLTVPTGVSYLRASLDCDGGAVDFDVSGFTVSTVSDVVITDGGLITYPVGWLWHTDDGDAPTPPTTGIIHIHLEGKPDAASTGVQVWAWNLGERDDA